MQSLMHGNMNGFFNGISEKISKVYHAALDIGFGVCGSYGVLYP